MSRASSPTASRRSSESPDMAKGYPGARAPPRPAVGRGSDWRGAAAWLERGLGRGVFFPGFTQSSEGQGTGLGTDAALCAVLSMAGAVTLSAQAKPEKPVSFTGDVGIVNTARNTSLTTLSVGDKLTIRSGKVLLTQTFALVYGKSEGVENANNQLLRGRADYQLASRLSGYGFIGYERNRFAGISHRTDEGVGLALAAARAPPPRRC